MDYETIMKNFGVGPSIDLNILADMVEANRINRHASKKANMYTFTYSVSGLNEDDVEKVLSDLRIYGDFCIAGDIEDRRKRTYLPFDQWPEGMLRSRQRRLDAQTVLGAQTVPPVISDIPVSSSPEPKPIKPPTMRERILDFITANNETGSTFTMLVSARGITSGVSFSSAMKSLEDAKKIEWAGDPDGIRKSKRWYLVGKRK